MRLPMRFVAFLNRNKTAITFGGIFVVAGFLVALGIWLASRNKGLYAPILIGIGTSLGATLVLQVTTTWFTGWCKTVIEKKFEAFFGNGSANRGGVRGVIALQSDSMPRRGNLWVMPPVQCGCRRRKR